MPPTSPPMMQRKPQAKPSPWWQPHVHADRRPFLMSRGRIKAAIRHWFEQHGFVEVDAAALQTSPGNEAHLHAFATELIGPHGRSAPLYLHTSPEFACKKLLAAGERRIFTFAPVYRNRERGALHHPEFTMLEWYRVEEPYEMLMHDCASLLAVTAEAAGTDRLSARGGSLDPYAPAERITVAEAFHRLAGIDLLATVSIGAVDRDGLASQASAAGIEVRQNDSWADIFSRVLVACVASNLGVGRATILDEYPVSEAALARAKAADPRVAERFELYAGGVELANGFGELGDPLEQRRRFISEMAEKARVYGESYPIDEDLLAALALMPPAAGIALGFDRLVMLATGADRIEQVIWTPVAEPDEKSAY